MNDKNTRLVEDCDWEWVEDDLDDLCGKPDEEKGNNSDSTDQFILEDEVIENIDDGEEVNVNLRERYAPSKQLTRNDKVHGIDSSLMKLILKRLFIWNEREILKIM